ncbi:MAG: hypothetical protein KAY24_09450 [Candidatus Eisenbacteria sp.]|nr:hypothetical protein [Candidatus Eisenbacteria bacterium]
MARRKSFLLRTDPEVLEALRKWASDELRSLNGQIEYLLRRSLRDAGRLKPGTTGRGRSGQRPKGA